MIYMLDTNICVYAINKHSDSYHNNLELLAKIILLLFHQ